MNFAALVAQKAELVHEYRRKKYESLIGGQIQIEKGHVQFADPHTVAVGGKKITADKVLN